MVPLLEGTLKTRKQTGCGVQGIYVYQNYGLSQHLQTTHLRLEHATHTLTFDITVQSISVQSCPSTFPRTSPLAALTLLGWLLLTGSFQISKIIVPSTAHADRLWNDGLLNDKHAEKVKHSRADSKIAANVERARDTRLSTRISTWKVPFKEILLADVALEYEQCKSLEHASNEKVAG